MGPVCGDNGKTYLNECLLEMSACINQHSVKKMTEGRCEVDAETILTEVNFATRTLSNKFKSKQQWELKSVVSGKKIPNGVRVRLNLQRLTVSRQRDQPRPVPLRRVQRGCVRPQS